MRLNNLTSTSRQPATEPAAAHPAAGQASVAPVGSLADAATDRRRSSREDMEEMEAAAMGPFEGRDQVLQNAHELAERLARLGPEAGTLVRAGSLPSRWHAIDDKA